MFLVSTKIVSDFYRNSEKGSSTCLRFSGLGILKIKLFMLTANRDDFSIFLLAEAGANGIEPQNDLSLMIQNSHDYYLVFYFHK